MSVAVIVGHAKSLLMCHVTDGHLVVENDVIEKPLSQSSCLSSCRSCGVTAFGRGTDHDATIVYGTCLLNTEIV